jgi:hypothetical protein
LLWWSIEKLVPASADGMERILYDRGLDAERSVACVRTQWRRLAAGQHLAATAHTGPRSRCYVTVRSSNELSLRKVVNGVVTELDHLAFTINQGQLYRLRFEAIGTKLVLYVNDQVRLQAHDSSLSQGRSGLVTYRASASFRGYSSWQP